MPCTILLFKTRAFHQIFFPRASVFLYNKCLKASNKKHTFLYLFIQFVFLIEIKDVAIDKLLNQRV